MVLMGVTSCMARLDLEFVAGLSLCELNEQITDSVRITRIQIMIRLIYVMVKFMYKFLLGKSLNAQK